MSRIPRPRFEVDDYTYSRFVRKIRFMGDCDCWFWIGARSKGGEGYGYFSYKKKNRMAHRIAYVWWVGPIPEGKQLDHLCTNMGCVNPKHLEPITQYENVVVRGTGITAQAAKKTTCPQGHEYTEKNTYINSKGARMCRECGRVRHKAWVKKTGYMHDGKNTRYH